MESQRWWKHRILPDLKRVENFYAMEGKNPQSIERSKRYPLCETIPLRPDFEKLHRPLLEVLASRRTYRELGRRPATFEEVSTLLLASFGRQAHLPDSDAQRTRSRTTPGPGGLFPSEIYYLSINSPELKKGIYHFQPEDGVLEVLPWDFSNERVSNVIPSGDVQSMVTEVSGIILITSVFQRLRRKYGNRYLRFALLEAGCICQNLDLVSNAMGLRLWNQGSFGEEAVRELLRIDGVSESVVHAAVLLGE